MNIKPLEDLKAKYLKEAYDIAESGGFDKLGTLEREIVQGHGSQIVLIGTIEKQAQRIAALEAGMKAISNKLVGRLLPAFPTATLQAVIKIARQALEDNP